MSAWTILILQRHARGITVTSARNANAIAVAEYVLAAMLHIARNLAAADASVRAGQWDRVQFGGTELWGRTLGLVGVGEIGRRVRTSQFLRDGPLMLRAIPRRTLRRRWQERCYLWPVQRDTRWH